MSPTQDQLREGALHITYELGMMRFALGLPKGIRVLPDPPGWKMGVQNLIIETMLLHARNVSEFLYPRKSARPDDIQAVHYLQSWDGDPETRLIAGSRDQTPPQDRQASLPPELRAR